MKMNKNIILILSFLVSSCKQDAVSINHRDMSDVELKRKLLTEGSIDAYEDLRIKLLDEDETYILPYSIIMANKYNYSRAFYDVFEVLIISRGCEDYNLDCLDENTKELALKYLKLAVEKEDETASKVLIYYYDKGKSYPIKELYENEELINKAKENIK
jgi:hypothetical protein